MSEKKGGGHEVDRKSPGGDADGDSNDGSEEKFDWEEHLAETKTNPAAPEWFWQSPTPPENRFEVGQKLEAVDPRNNTITSVATVVAVFGPKIKLRLDGAGSTNDFWTLVDSSKIHYFGYTEENGSFLQPPLSYEKDPVRYQNSIINAAKASGNLATKSCFLPEPPRPASNMFKIGTKLEAIDKRNPTWICPATVVGREREKITIEYLGWGQVDTVRYDSRDLYPCGWWEKANCSIGKPPDMPKKKDPPAYVPPVPPAPSIRRPGRPRGRPPKVPRTPPRPHSTGTTPLIPLAQEYQNIFDAVMAKTASPPDDHDPDPLCTSTPTPSQNIPGSASTTPADSVKPLFSADTPGQSAKESAPVLLKHAARKSIVTRPVVLEANADVAKGPANDSPSSSGTPIKNGRVKTEKDWNNIPEPDTVISTRGAVTLHLNENCNGGPFLDTVKLGTLFAASSKGLPLHISMRDAFQMLVNSAHSQSAFQVFGVMPVANMNSPKALSITGVEKDGRVVVRYLPMYNTSAVAQRALREVLLNLKACPNLLGTVETGCNQCFNASIAKRTKYSEDDKAIDTPGNQNMADIEVNSEETSETAWWAGQDPSQWNVDDVVRFVSSLIDSHAADLFKNQEIDGTALILLTPEIMIKFMGMRVGPAVKISNAIERLKGTTRPNYVNASPTVPRAETEAKDQE